VIAMGTKDDDLDKLFDKTKPPGWRGLKENELFDYEFTASDPESLEGISHEDPPKEEPEVELSYDMTGRGVRVRCVYCKWPNHYVGIVVRYPSGARRLVGRDCGLTHHGVKFARNLKEFDAIVERQGYVRRRRALIEAGAAVFREFSELRRHPAVATHDRVMRAWRYELGELAAAIANIARRAERLTVHRQVRDVEAEMARRARLGAGFEEARQKAKAAGDQWQLFKPIEEDVGPLEGALFFAAGVPAARRLEDNPGESAAGFQDSRGRRP
jgi:hypothetical protein